MSAIKKLRHVSDNLAWMIRSAKFSLLIRLYRLEPASPHPLTAPFFRAVENAITKMLDENLESEYFFSLEGEWEEYLSRLSKDTVVHADITTMADASYQQWIDNKFPDIGAEMRVRAMAHYRAYKR